MGAKSSGVWNVWNVLSATKTFRSYMTSTKVFARSVSRAVRTTSRRRVMNSVYAFRLPVSWSGYAGVVQTRNTLEAGEVAEDWAPQD